MTILGPLVLPADVIIAPVDELAPDLREQIGEGDFSVTRPRTRSMSSVVDARTARLLEAFRTPARIVDAVIAVSDDPRSALDDAVGVLLPFVQDGLLVAADSELARPIETTLAPGDKARGFEVLAPVQVILDTEVYLAGAADGTRAALKLARPGSEAAVRDQFANEAAVLAALDGEVSPRLLDHGELDGRPLLAMSWCDGVDVFEAAAEARALGEGAAELAVNVIAAYAHLHAQGVLHGDVHPRNVLVDGDGAVTIIDFGYAGPPGYPWRAGIDFFMEPELAAARLSRGSAPLSERGEQYALAALVQLMLTGSYTHDFSLDGEAMLRQLLELPPRTPDGPLGAVLVRALAKAPEERFGSVAQLLDAFRAAMPAVAPRVVRRTPAILDEVLARLAKPEALELPAPTASAMNGAAGFAYALARIAGIRGDPELFALADLWCVRAGLALRTEEAFWNEELEIVPEQFGERSLYHTATGVHCVSALLARARGDDWGLQVALDAFVAEASEPCPHADVAFGRAGLLLGCALLLDALPAHMDGAALRALGDDLHASLAGEQSAQPAIAESEKAALGAAHGWAGELFARLRWAQASGQAPPQVQARLEQLAALGQPAGRGLRWPHAVGALIQPGLDASWCNGTAGYVHLWTLAHHSFGDEAYARVARMAAWSAYTGAEAAGDLCCGHAGRAYALLSMYRHDGDRRWALRARELADGAAEGVRRKALRRDSLYKGEVGVALLAADIEAPEDACMPLFAAEGWS